MSSNSRHWVLHHYLQVNGGAERLVIPLAWGLNEFGLGVSGVYPDFSGTRRLDGLHYEVPLCQDSCRMSGANASPMSITGRGCRVGSHADVPCRV